jgi:hypothetical protein
MCAECKFAEIVRNNHDKLVYVCVCRESDNFLHELEIAFDNCELGFVDDDEEGGAE